MAEILYIPHGGGPLPLMGDTKYARLTAMLRDLNSVVADSKAIVLISAHWEAGAPTVCTAPFPGMLYDYYGFPEETYRYNYPAPGAPELAGRIRSALAQVDLDLHEDPVRGFDHATFVPMMLMRPKADIPILQMSLCASLDPAEHLLVGRALSTLLDDGYSLIGSGFSFHNIGALTGKLKGDREEQQRMAKSFHDWLDETVCGENLNPAEKKRRLASWYEAPGARFCHPREEHLLPLHVCFGAAAEKGLDARIIFSEPVKGYQTSGYRWSL